MSRSISSSRRSREMPRLCNCWYLISLSQAWTDENPGRKFYACPLYDPMTKTRGSEFFEWHDKSSTILQRDIILELKDEKERVVKEIEVLKKELAEANAKVRKVKYNFLQLKMKKGGVGVFVRVGLCILIGVIVLVILVKLSMM